MWLRSLFRRVWALFRAQTIHHEIDEEMRFHIDMRTEENIRGGMSPDEARKDAEQRFGRLTRVKERGYEVRGGRWLETSWQDVRYGVRILRKNPGFTIVAVLTLGLGIGANTAIFSVVNSVLLRPLNYREPDRIVALWENVPAKGGKWRVAPANFFDWKTQTHVFDEMAALSASTYNLTGDKEPEQLRGVRVSSDYFDVLGVAPALGRAFSPEEYEPGKGQVVILGSGLWERRFSADPNVVGKVISLDGSSHIIIGVMPKGIYPAWPTTSETISIDPNQNQYLVPMSFLPNWADNRNSHVLGVIARLRPGVTVAGAQKEMNVIGLRLEEEHPTSNRGAGIVVRPLADGILGDVRTPLWVLLGTVGFVLLIACANVASLLLAQLAARRREIAVRVAMGARRAQLVRQFLVEGLLLSLLGGAVGVLLANWGLNLLLKIIPQKIPRLDQVGLDLSVLIFALLLSFCITLVFGLVPALQASRADLHDALREVGRNVGTSPGRQRFRRLLVVTQISMAMVLVIGATLLIKSFWHLRKVNPGFNPEHVAVMNLTLPQSKYREWHQISAFYDQLLEQIRSMPGVRSASIAYDQPLASNWIDSFTIAGRPEAEPGQKLSECFRPVGDDYFLSLSIELLKGRPFTKQDDPSHPGVTIINDAFARKYFPNENPLGQQIESSTPSRMSNGPMPTSFEIVGVVRDTKFQGLSADTAPAFYIPAKQFPLSDMVVMARVEGDPLTYSQPLRDAVRSLDRDQPINPITSMETILAEDISQPRFNMLLMGLFGALALVLALIGIYGLLSYAVAQRTQEIGLRMALGAQAQDVLKLVVGQGMRLVLLGVAIGVAAALLLTRVMRSLLFGVTATDAQTFGSTVLIMAAVAFLACLLPALRATKVDPNMALRYE